MSVTLMQYWPSHVYVRVVAVEPGMALDELDQVAVGVLDEADRDRPTLGAWAP